VGGIMRILVVDDEYVSLSKLDIILKNFGETVAVTNGKQAYEAFINAYEEGNPFQLITLDVNLPDIKGQEVLKMIRKWEDEVLTTVKIIPVKVLMISALDDAKTVVSSFKEGCEEYVIKPFNMDKIRNALIMLNLI